MWFKKLNEIPNKNFINSGEYERLHKRITEINTELEICKSQCKILQTDVDNLRGKFNRKLKGIEQEEKKDEKVETQTYIKDEMVAFG